MNIDDFVSIQFTKEVPKYLQISESIAALITEGRLPVGDRLPSIRKLAGMLSVNTVTIISAYEHLQSLGLVAKKPGSGVFVKNLEKMNYSATDFEQKPTKISEPPPPPYGSELNDDELYLDKEIELMQKGTIILGDESINFATSTPSADHFPVEAFKLALNTVLDRDGGRAFEYDESNGYAPLRERISSLLESRYDIRIPAQRLQAISGAQQGIDIAAKALLKPGDRVLVEDPTYTGALAVFKSRGATIIGVPMEPDGINIRELKKSIEMHQPKLIYCMPDFQNPTTFSYSSSKRKALIEIARRAGCYIIEDDYVSDLGFLSGIQSRPLKSFDQEDNERVIYIKSFSKLLMPGLRIGFLSAPGSIARNILQAKHLTDIASSGLIQRAFDAYLRSGEWESHLEYIRSLFQLRHALLVKAVSTFFPGGFSGTVPKGGFNLWVPLPQGISAADIFRASSAKGVLCTPGNVFRTGTMDHDDHIRLSIAALSEDKIDEGVRIIAQTIEAAQKAGLGLGNTGEYISPML
jgi:2-aminoadipate transaminase